MGPLRKKNQRDRKRNLSAKHLARGDFHSKWPCSPPRPNTPAIRRLCWVFMDAAHPQEQAQR